MATVMVIFLLFYPSPLSKDSYKPLVPQTLASPSWKAEQSETRVGERR